MAVKFTNYTYEALPKDALYDLLALRSEVFVVEQKCFYNDPDGLDKVAHHILAEDQGQLVGCARILPPSVKNGDNPLYHNPSIGRYLLHSQLRGQGVGRNFFAETFAVAQKKYPNQGIYLQGQLYLRAFYESFGFRVIGDIYPEAGIDHVDMLFVV